MNQTGSLIGKKRAQACKMIELQPFSKQATQTGFLPDRLGLVASTQVYQALLALAALMVATPA